LAIHTDGNLISFDTEEHALNYALDGTTAGVLLPGTAPSQNLPAAVMIPLVASMAVEGRSRCKGGFKAH